METKALQPVTAGEKQSWTSIAFIWIGGMICIPLLMVGALMSQYFALGETLLLTTGGFVVCIALMCFTGMIASDTGLPAAVVATKGFGEFGSRLLISILIAVVQIGWFGLQTAMCGAAFATLMEFIGISFPMWLSCLIWGIVMLISAIYGYTFMKILNYIAVPSLFIVCIYGIIASTSSASVNIFAAVPPQAGQMPVSAALSMMVGAFAMGTIIVCDIARYAKNRKDTIKSSYLGVLPATLFMMFTGGATAMATGEGDITVVFAQMGMAFFGMLVLVLATWTTNTTNAYTAGLAVMKVFNLKDKTRPLVTMACGLLGTVLAMIGIISQFESIISLLGSVLPPVAGVMLSDYWIVGKGKKENFRTIPGVNWIGIVSWAVGAAVGLFFSFFSPALDGTLIAIILYAVLAKFCGGSMKLDQPAE